MAVNIAVKQKYMFLRFCCKNSQGNTMDVMFLLGGHSKEAGDTGDLSQDVSFFIATHLPFPDHVHHLVALHGSSRRLQRKETHPGLDKPFDEAVILLDEMNQAWSAAL